MALLIAILKDLTPRLDPVIRLTLNQPLGNSRFYAKIENKRDQMRGQTERLAKA